MSMMGREENHDYFCRFLTLVVCVWLDAEERERERYFLLQNR